MMKKTLLAACKGLKQIANNFKVEIEKPLYGYKASFLTRTSTDELIKKLTNKDITKITEEVFARNLEDNIQKFKREFFELVKKEYKKGDLTGYSKYGQGVHLSGEGIEPDSPKPARYNEGLELNTNIWQRSYLEKQSKKVKEKTKDMLEFILKKEGIYSANIQKKL